MLTPRQRLAGRHLVAALLACIGLAQSASSFAIGYTFRTLGTPGSESSQAFGINNTGQILVSATNSDESSMLIRQGSQITNLSSIAGMGIAGWDINNSGHVAGFIRPDGGATHAMKWDTQAVTDLGAPGNQNWSYATAINDQGQVVGNSQITQSQSHAVLWSNGTALDLGTLGGSNSYARNINNAGAIVGFAYTGTDNAHATLWINGIAQDLGSLGGGNGDAYAINEKGQIVGTSLNSSGEYHATLWNNGVITDLGTLNQGGWSFSNATDINESGLIVGVATDRFERPRATMWLDGAITDLNTFLSAQNVADGWRLTAAAGVNDRGWIIGEAFNNFSGQTHAFLLAPSVPEPAAGLMLVAGMVMLLGLKTRKDGRHTGRFA